MAAGKLCSYACNTTDNKRLQQNVLFFLTVFLFRRNLCRGMFFIMYLKWVFLRFRTGHAVLTEDNFLVCLVMLNIF